MKAILAAALAPVLALPLLLTVILGGTSASQAAGLPPLGCVVPNAPGTAQTVGQTALTGEQVGVIRTSLGVVKARHLPRWAGVVLMATERQESVWRNLHSGDRDSLGVLQQRASWGSEADRMNVAVSVGKFLDRLVNVPGWQTRTVAEDAQAVQISADGSLYQVWALLAVEVVAAFWDGSVGTCQGGDPGAAPNAQAAAVLARARAMLGRPYCWVGGDANGPTHGDGGAGCGPGVTGFDCSGLTLYAWAPYVALAHYTGDQVNMGRRVPLAQAKPGDLVFLISAGSSVPHHVAMIWSVADAAGDGQIIEAQDFNVPVHVRAWRAAQEPEAMNFAVRLVG